MGWKILLPQEIMSEGRKLLEDAGHTVIDGRGFETEDVLADFKEYQPDAMIVRITPITREVIESNPNLKVIVRHGAGFDALDVKACHDNNVQALYAPVANSTSQEHIKRQDYRSDRLRQHRKPRCKALPRIRDECSRIRPVQTSF